MEAASSSSQLRGRHVGGWKAEDKHWAPVVRKAASD